jgi:hypothetical protein
MSNSLGVVMHFFASRGSVDLFPKLTKLQSETHRADVIRRAVGLQIELTRLGSVLMTVRSGSGGDKPEGS